MSRTREGAARDVWRKRFQRFGRSGMAVAQFCLRERVSVASFYYWRKKLRPQARLQHTAPPPRETRRQHTTVRQQISPQRGVFRPVAVVSTVAASAGGVSILLPCGTRIEVGAEHLDAVRAVVAEVTRAVGRVARQDRDLESGASSC